MFKGSTKKERRPFSFQQQLELKLKHLKEETTSAHKIANKKKQIATVLEQAVNEMQLEDESSIQNIYPTHSRNTLPHKYPIKEMSEHKIQEQPYFAQKFKINLKQQNNNDSERIHTKKENNHIWNLVSGEELVTFLMLNFQHYREEHHIMLTDFVMAAIQYYLGLQLDKAEIASIQKQIKDELTTTDPQVLSLNALEILNKKISIKYYIIQAYLEVKLKQKMSELQRKNKKLMSEVGSKIDSLVLRQEQLQNKSLELGKREINLNSKQKNLQLRQKQLLQRQKELKKTIEQKCYKLSQSYTTQISEKTKQAEKKLNLLEKNIRTKLELIERKSLHLKELITEANQLKIKKNQSEGESKLRVKKLERELENMQKKYRGEIEQLEGEQKQMLRSITALQDKLAKSQKKLKKQKERIEQLQQFEKSARSKLEGLEQQNRQLKVKLQQLLSKIPQENILKTVKEKEKTSRSNKSKHKKCKNQINSIILIYEKVMSVLELNTKKVDAMFVSKLIELSKCLLPEILSLVCNDQDNVISAPHHLILFIAHSVFSSTLKSTKYDGQLSESEVENEAVGLVQNRIWSNELASLMQMPFSHITKRSIFLFVLPFLEWSSPSATHFFNSTLEQCCTQIESIVHMSEESLSSLQLQLFTSKGLINFLISDNLQRMIKELADSLEANDRLERSLKMSNSVMDLFLLISKDHRQNIADSPIIQKLISIFSFLVLSLTSPYSQSPKKHSTAFKYYQLLQQLCQKLSILIQRVVYQTNMLKPKSAEVALIKKAYRELEELNRVNGQRNSLILANLNSILSGCQPTA